MMQQTQQILLSVKHKLPQPNSILPSQLIKSQPAHHIRKRVHDIVSTSSYNWPLDKCINQKQDHITSILSNYYGPNYDITQLLKLKNKIVFLNSMVDPLQHQDDNYYFGSINSSIAKPRRSRCNPLVNQQTYQLQFQDKIQSGNLYFALQHQPRVYLLANRLDYNTRSFGQWFYFKVRNVTKQSGLFKFYIVNMTKNGTLFGKGLKVSVCRDGVWTKQGTDIGYVSNKFVRKRINPNKRIIQEGETYYTLAFSLQIGSHETIYVSYNQPYTYTKLGKKLDQIMSNNTNISRSVLSRTPLGNRVQIITITKQNNIKDKKIIFITARAHPVQTAGSFVVQGIIDELLKPSQPYIVNEFLQNYIVKIVPMINPDGVIVGNSRCNIYGFDLNRQWKDPTHSTAPQIMSLKRAILKYEGRIQMFLDLHGHSTKKSVFAYGCHDTKNPVATRQFPYLLSKFSDKDFRFSQCKFSMLTQAKNNNKDGTARVCLWRRLKIPNIFTIQNSYCSAYDSQIHYDSKGYASIGKDIVFSLCSYFRKQESQQIQQEKFKSAELSKSLGQIHFQKRMILDSLKNNTILINSNIMMNSDVSSDSEPEDRVIITQSKFQSPKKLNRNKIFIKQKRQKDNETTLKQQKQKKNTTIQVRKVNQTQIQNEEVLIYSASNLQKNHKRKYIRNLSPLTKQSISYKKFSPFQQKQYEQIGQPTRVDSQPRILKLKPQPHNLRKTNVLSIIQIGTESQLQRPSHTQQMKQMKQMKKIVSAKNINSQYGIYHRLNTLNSSSSKNKMVKCFQNTISPDLQTFTDYHQFRQPTLKVKKNIPNSSKLQDFINKINAIQSMRGMIPSSSKFQINISGRNK